MDLEALLRNKHLHNLYNGSEGFGIKILSNKCIQVLDRESKILDLKKMEAFIVFFDYDRKLLDKALLTLKTPEDLEKLAVYMMNIYRYTLGYKSEGKIYKIDLQREL